MAISRKQSRRLRRSIVTIVAALGLLGWFGYDYLQQSPAPPPSPTPQSSHVNSGEKATTALEKLAVKGRAPKTGYERSQFGSGWSAWRSCDIRNKILARDMTSVQYQEDTCTVKSGILSDPYTSETIHFTRGATTSSEVQIDHVVALADAWQKGAQQLSQQQREAFANDDLNLLAVDGDTNQQKGAGDAATWLPKNRVFRCQYVARQIAVKAKYALWVTHAEKEAMGRVLSNCPDQRLPQP